MTRRPTPSIIDAVLTADVLPDRTALRGRLRWDYSQVAPVDRKTVEDAAVDILANGQRMQESAAAAGRRLLDVKHLLPHGQFSDWCQVEFGMSQRMAQIWMNIARTFDGKSEIISLFSETSIALLAAPSTPEPARQEAIAEAQANGRSPSVQRTKEIIAQHKPGPVPAPIPQPTAKEYSAAVQAAQPARIASETPAFANPSPAEIIENQIDTLAWEAGLVSPQSRIDHLMNPANFAYYRDNVRKRAGLQVSDAEMNDAMMAVVADNLRDMQPAPVTVDAEPAPARIRGYNVLDDYALRAMPAPANAYDALAVPDGRISAARHLMALYGAVIDSEEQYGELTGRFSDTLTVKRELTHMITHLADLIAIIEHPEEVTPAAD